MILWGKLKPNKIDKYYVNLLLIRNHYQKSCPITTKYLTRNQSTNTRKNDPWHETNYSLSKINYNLK